MLIYIKWLDEPLTGVSYIFKACYQATIMKHCYKTLLTLLAFLLPSFIVSVSTLAQNNTAMKDYIFILNYSPSLSQRYPDRPDVPKKGGEFHALSYGSYDIAFIYNEYMCGYYHVPLELQDGFKAGTTDLQKTNPTLYWKKVKEIMAKIDRYWANHDSIANEQKKAKAAQIQEDTRKENASEIVDQMPSYPGGMGALMQFLSSHLKYPADARKNGKQVRVICKMVIEEDGTVTNVKVVQSIDPSLDKEAVRVLESMPKWIPGKSGGTPVRVVYTLPVTFRLQ